MKPFKIFCWLFLINIVLFIICLALDGGTINGSLVFLYIYPPAMFLEIAFLGCYIIYKILELKGRE